MIEHSIIIPHHNRKDALGMCLGSLEFAKVIGNAEVLLVDSDPGSVASFYWPGVRVVRGRQQPGKGGYYSKSQAVNDGIEASRGKVITLLDCDMIVGRDFGSGYKVLLEDESITKLCYRVREFGQRSPRPTWREIAEAFARYDATDLGQPVFPLGFEGRVDPLHNRDVWDTGGDPPEPLFGNSQQSIRREVLGDLRMNEDFMGGPFEDLWLNREIFRRADSYKAVLAPEPGCLLFHQTHDKWQKDWRTPLSTNVNRDIYRNT